MDIFSRWLHIAAAAVAVGGLVYGRVVLASALQVLGEEDRSRFLGKLSARLKPLAVTVIIALVASGSYNLLNVLQRGEVGASYHMVFAVKFLLAVHVFGMLFLAAMPPSGNSARDAKRPRLILGAAISGLVIMALGAYLRTLHG